MMQHSHVLHLVQYLTIRPGIDGLPYQELLSARRRGLYETRAVHSLPELIRYYSLADAFARCRLVTLLSTYTSSFTATSTSQPQEFGIANPVPV